MKWVWVAVLALALAACSERKADDAVQQILEAEREANTHEEWHEMEARVADTRRELFYSATYSASDVCESLESLDVTDTVTFYDDLLNEDSNITPECRARLLGRVDDFFQDKQDRLSYARPKLNPCTSSTARVPQGTLGPSLEVELDNGAHETIVRGGLPKCHISFTFDDGPHSKLTPQLLNLLAGEEVKVNFFTLGERVRGATDIVLRAAREGHIVGNHTYSHKNLPTLRQSDAEAEIVRGFQELEKVFGGFIPFFRFPYGASTKSLKQFIYRHNWLDFMWNMDTLDWKIKDPEELYRNVLSQIEREKSGVILFHDIHPQTLTVMPFVLEALNEAGYSSVVFQPKDPLHGPL